MRLIPWVPFDSGRLSVHGSRPFVLDLRSVGNLADLTPFTECAVPLSAECIPLLPPDPFAPAWGILTRGRFKSIAIDGLRVAQQARACTQVAGLQQPYARAIIRLGAGDDDHDVAEIADLFGSALRAIWYGASDLIVDYRSLRGESALIPSTFPRVPLSDWTRGKLLVVARALGVEFWGQTNLTMTERADRVEWAETFRLAAAEGFDVLVER